jgi:hypothetical protein
MTTFSKAFTKRGVFWLKNHCKINYGQTGVATFFDNTDEECYFRPDGEKKSYLVFSYCVYFPEEHSYYFGLEAAERIKNLQKEIFGCK